MIRRLFSPPKFEKEEDTFRAMFINGFSWVVIVILLISLIPPLFNLEAIRGVGYTTLVLLVLIGVMVFALYLLRKGNVSTSGLIVVILGWLGLGFQAFTADGVRDVIVIAYIAVSLLASIVISWRAGGYLMLVSIASIWVLAFFEVNSVFVARVQSPLDYARDLTLIFIVITSLIYFSTNSLRDAIARASRSEKDLLASNKNLQELNQTLEERVSNRTIDLEIASRINERRARQFETVAQVANVISTIQDLETLLPKIAQVISEQFGHYHTGIFLLDEAREFAVLKAANTEGGKKMLAREHRLKVGQTGIVGYVTGTGKPRVALDTDEDAAFFNNPDLPNTHSEMALPLSIAGQLIGALDVQSVEANAFGQEDIEVLSTLAAQVSVAIQNARSFRDAQKLLAEAQSVTSGNISEAWKVMRPISKSAGYQKTGSSLKPLEKGLEGEHIQLAVEKGETVARSSSLTVPIRLRGQVIGVVNLQVSQNHSWNPDEVDIAEAVAERLSLAIETATLLHATQRRADIERITADISGKISSSTRFETILQTAAQELSRALGGSDVLVQIEPIAMKINPSL